jgi:hypothetical protein
MLCAADRAAAQRDAPFPRQRVLPPCNRILLWGALYSSHLPRTAAIRSIPSFRELPLLEDQTVSGPRDTAPEAGSGTRAYTVAPLHLA